MVTQHPVPLLGNNVNWWQLGGRASGVVISLGGVPCLLRRGEKGGMQRKEQAWELDLTGRAGCYLPPAISILLPNDALLGYIRVHYVFIEYALCCQVCPVF